MVVYVPQKLIKEYQKNAQRVRDAIASSPFDDAREVVFEPLEVAYGDCD